MIRNKEGSITTLQGEKKTCRNLSFKSSNKYNPNIKENVYSNIYLYVLNVMTNKTKERNV